MVQKVRDYDPATTEFLYRDLKIEYVYFSGKGRSFGSWIDTINGSARVNHSGTDPGYGAGSFIENPVYIVESVCRSEGGFDEDDLDLASFDTAGSVSGNGELEEIFGTVATAKFAFSQSEVIGLKSFWEKMGRQSGTLYFISGSGKLKAKVRRLQGGYSSGVSDFVVDYSDIRNVKYSKSPMSDVSNSVTMKYDYDHALQETTKTKIKTDATSAGSSVDGFNATLEYEDELNTTLNGVTAESMAIAVLDWRKDRHIIIDFEINQPRYQALEISDIVLFSNWPSTVKVLGTTISSTTNHFMVLSVTKSGPAKTKLTLMEVSG